MMEDVFLARLTTRIAARMDEWHRTNNPRRKQILKHEIWTLNAVLRDYKSESKHIFVSDSKARAPQVRVSH